MANGKWLTDLKGETPLAEAARQVLEARLGAIPERLAQAVFEADKDPEHVHQLRVLTRRGGAALDIFAGCLPEKLYRRARRRLRRLRRAAGAARDWDVFLQMVAARVTRARREHKPGLDFMLGFAAGERAAAQDDLREATRRKPRDWKSYVAGVLNAVQETASSSTPTLAEMAQPHLCRLVHELEEAARKDLSAYEHLHRVRILGKQLRYAMEIFAGCHGPEFRDRYYPAIEQMQELLGQANDSYVAGQRLRAICTRLEASQPRTWKRLRAGLETLQRFHERRLPGLRRQFDRWWRQWLELNMAGHYRLFA
jgi:CHAD domain-containing protein